RGVQQDEIRVGTSGQAAFRSKAEQSCRACGGQASHVRKVQLSVPPKHKQSRQQRSETRHAGRCQPDILAALRFLFRQVRSMVGRYDIDRAVFQSVLYQVQTASGADWRAHLGPIPDPLEIILGEKRILRLGFSGYERAELLV